MRWALRFADVSRHLNEICQLTYRVSRWKSRSIEERDIERKRLGSSNLYLSLIGIGGNKFGTNLNSKTMTREVLDTALDLGINFIDTAAAYGEGESETFFGEALRGRRDQFIVSTKTYLSDRGAVPVAEHLRQRCAESLRKLETDYVDLYQIHRADPNVPTEEVMLGLNELVQAGMVREIGCSNYATWRLAESNLFASDATVAHFVSIQREYNLLKRSAESELVDACRHFDVSIIPYFPLASGLLWRGEFNGKERWPVSSAARQAHIKRAQSVMTALQGFANSAGHTLGQLAIAWLTAKDFTGPVITGVRSAEQLRANAAASEWRLSPDELAIVDEISSMGDEIRADDPFGRAAPPKTGGT